LKQLAITGNHWQSLAITFSTNNVLAFMKKISIPDALPNTGHYSTAVVANGFVFVSGILPVHPLSGEKLVGASFKDQASLVLENLVMILAAADTSMNNLVKVTVYVSDIADWEEFNELYATKLGSHKPARAVVPVNKLHSGFVIELEAIALATQ
jgi:2-iminobutanoate/2-iminopropanoate deaminase